MSARSDKNELNASRIPSVVRKSERPGEEPWEQSFNGLTWQDMPNLSREHKLFDFALYRRGLYDVQIDLSDDVDEADEESGGPKKRKVRQLQAQRNFGTIGSRRRPGAMAKTKPVRESLDSRAERMAMLLERYAKAKLLPENYGFVRAFYKLDPSAHSALSRARGAGRGIEGPLQTVSLDRVTRAFETLKEGGWKI